ncbi:hypothetical protein KKJ06_06270 [Xenorhabdus bovienii]|uniref:Uncharacterized protein n=1 Tax=Xenorhabdus bovienii str. Intermedium TaxID=1379677 RepID=A0A077QPW4_XENBV|nr:hypothetical protein [Xenorhabdus bovienii]MDE9452730.1 hypothetical protein [Xenorhabdus bovienii]MDE9555053.1 hypothetical protein [Xenorhabdus bovienii]CDH34541.1 conserved hypothetical protein [Xenorhabdus bovienii str. Intermedium]
MINSIKKWLTKKTEGKVNHDARISRLSTVCDPFLDEDIGMLDKEKIKTEGFIELINNKKCEIRYGRSNYRENILLASLSGFLLGFCFFIDDCISTWKADEKFNLIIVSNIKEKYGEDFYLNPKLPDDFKIYEYIADAESISFPQYFHMRYTDSGFYNKSRVRKYLLLDGGFFLFSITMILIHLWVLSLLRKISPLVIDRKKQLFYTWRKGRMYVARYSQVDVVNLYDVLYLRVYGFDKNNKLMIYAFEPRIPNLIDDIISKKYLLAFVAKYFIQGKESISSVDFKRQSSIFSLCKNPKPTDWETQITAILAELDRLGPPKGATDPK